MASSSSNLRQHIWLRSLKKKMDKVNSGGLTLKLAPDITDEEYNNIASRDLRSPSPQSPNASASSAVTYQAVPNTDELPTAFSALEGIFNDLTSQLQKLAGRVDMVNEWIDLDKIVLARFRSYDLAAMGHEIKSIDDLHRVHYPDGNNIAWSCRVVEMTERIEGMRRCRKELERSVCWLRAEYWRVETAMGRKPEETAGRSEAADLGKWTGSSGRIPTQREWESMFSE